MAILAAVVVVKRVPLLCLCEYLHIHSSSIVSVGLSTCGGFGTAGGFGSSAFVVPVVVLSSLLVWRAPSGQ